MRVMGAFLTPSTAYMGVLRELIPDEGHVLQPCHVSPRGSSCREIIDLLFTVLNPSTGPLITQSPARNEVMAKYLAAEEELYLTGERRAKVWAERASKFWAKLGDAEGNVTSNYGWLMFMNKSLPGNSTPWEWAMDRLREDPDTRQAYIRVSLPEHQWNGNPDQTCTMHMMLLFRHGHLHATTVMRSNDVVKGLAYDLPWFCRVLIMAADELKMPVGHYTHFAHSMHLYDKDVDIARNCLGL